MVSRVHVCPSPAPYRAGDTPFSGTGDPELHAGFRGWELSRGAQNSRGRGCPPFSGVEASGCTAQSCLGSGQEARSLSGLHEGSDPDHRSPQTGAGQGYPCGQDLGRPPTCSRLPFQA
ncbi:procollagen galactosyltransferase 1 [Platysternon megacephalum]|uniref:Procollagen galactosyltransferase 1 n=1 Tax=Platysternon megacephalum TaxID=55544 RepID=A0A4D9DN12_9SAUR|nr:procollagen galactosyltransferase 1 [Platysternon megacephalum]